MSQSGYLVFPNAIPVSGLSNTLMELEIRVALAMLSNRILVSANKFHIASQPDDILYNRSRNARLLDLFDLPIQYLTLKQFNESGASVHHLPWRGNSATQAYFTYPSKEHFDSFTESQFRHSRILRWEFPQSDLSEIWNATSVRRTFSHYSYFFLTSESDKKRISDTVAKVKPKQPYRLLAKKIIRSLDSFNAIHVRLGDFRDWWVKSPTPEEILLNIAKVLPEDELLVICTDNSKDNIFFSEIRRKYPQSVFLDQFIEREFSDSLKTLAFNDATVMAMLTQLVTVEAKVFIGTLFSTFSGIIHRKRLLKNPTEKILFTFNPFDSQETPMVDCEFIPVKKGRFSWNQHIFPIPLSAWAYAWFREWPESVTP